MDKSYRECIEACLDCIKACKHCAASCLREEDVAMMTLCIELDLACASICETAVTFMELENEHTERLCKLCAEVCQSCADECEKHDMQHCQDCAAACRKCAEACTSMA